MPDAGALSGTELLVPTSVVLIKVFKCSFSTVLLEICQPFGEKEIPGNQIQESNTPLSSYLLKDPPEAIDNKLCLLATVNYQFLMKYGKKKY